MLNVLGVLEGFPLEHLDHIARLEHVAMTRAGLEPATYGLKVRCSTN